jgi:phage tail-like protein
MLYEREPTQRRLVRVPDVVGLSLQKALLLMQHAGLRIGAILYKESYEEKDTILEQKPLRGQMVYASDEVTLWISRESYIKWLPAIYQRSDATGKNYVRDLLWIIQHLFGSIEAMLDGIHLYFNSYETPEQFLPWLAAWSAMILEPDWPEVKKRRLIKKAMELYRLRGTVRGLKLFISLFTGYEPHLAENEWPFNGFRIGVSSTVGIDTVILPPVDKSHSFVCVMPHKFRDLTAQSIIRLHEIIEMEKPSHSTYMLKFEEPRQSVEEREFYRIGVSSGVNIGQEVVTPLPISEETGEPDYPQEPVMPPPPPNPSVYELFGTKKRQLPPVVGASKADGAPVEGREITTSKYGFEGAREFRLDDIMKELLERAGLDQSVGVSIESGGSGEPGGFAKEDINPGIAELEKHDVGEGGGEGDAALESALGTPGLEERVLYSTDGPKSDKAPGKRSSDEGPSRTLADKSPDEIETGLDAEESGKTPVTDSAPPTHDEGGQDEDGNIPRAGLGATVEGGISGRKPKIDLDVSVEEIDADSVEELDPADAIAQEDAPPQTKANDVQGSARVDGNVKTAAPRVEVEIEKREVSRDAGDTSTLDEKPTDGSKK